MAGEDTHGHEDMHRTAGNQSHRAAAVPLPPPVNLGLGNGRAVRRPGIRQVWGRERITGRRRERRDRSIPAPPPPVLRSWETSPSARKGTRSQLCFARPGRNEAVRGSAGGSSDSEGNWWGTLRVGGKPSSELVYVSKARILCAPKQRNLESKFQNTFNSEVEFLHPNTVWLYHTMFVCSLNHHTW